ncbi:MAG TPA: ABC transporter ATP-binding protein [Gammaproteobacteria bacterium]|nr:ABC transporter ATP-binding protein [Gammaproteobacteria bacterium]
MGNCKPEMMMKDSDTQLIKIDALTKVYATDEVETYAINGISFDIDRGEYVAILGPSGCGKTSLMSILGLLSTPTGGNYLLNGTAVEDLDNADRAHIRNKEIGFIFQTFNLIGDLSVYENVELPLVYRGGVDKDERRRRVNAVLERVGMAHRVNHYPSQLSGGQQQRVAVARALVGEPSILLADEPTGNLDSASGEAVMELMDELHQAGATICMVTHDPRYATRAARTIQLFDGQIVDEDITVESPAPAASPAEKSM